MKTKSVMLAAAIAASQFLNLAAFAQSSSATVAAPAAAAPASTSVAEAPAAKSKIAINYLGIMYGQALTNESEGRTYLGDDMYLNNRPSIKYNVTDNLDFGLQARFNVKFQKDGMDVVNDPWRLFSNIKNIYKDDVLQFNVLARAFLPTRIKDHNRGLLPSPELMPMLNISPKNSRFSLSVYPQLLKFLYKDDAVARSANAPSFIALGNFEGTYQLTGNTAITFGFYPEYVMSKQVALNNDSNELDLGYNWDFAKGWSLNPFVAMEFVGMGADNAAVSKNMALNVVLSGAIL